MRFRAFCDWFGFIHLFVDFGSVSYHKLDFVIDIHSLCALTLCTFTLQITINELHQQRHWERHLHSQWLLLLQPLLRRPQHFVWDHIAAPKFGYDR